MNGKDKSTLRELKDPSVGWLGELIEKMEDGAERCQKWAMQAHIAVQVPVKRKKGKGPLSTAESILVRNHERA